MTSPAERVRSATLGYLERAGPNPHLRLQAAARRRWYRRAIDRHTAGVLRTIDRAGFHARFRDDPFYRGLGGDGSSKYIHLERWMRVAVARYYAFGFHRLPAGSRVLDLGCGSGFFLLVCNYFGHEAVGLDLEIDELYNRQIEFFGLERVTHLITPSDFLPKFDPGFDVICSFMMAFNWELYTDLPWPAETWSSFLPELRRITNDDGRVLLWFNRNPVTGEYYSEAVAEAITASPDYRARFFANCLDLRPLP